MREQIKNRLATFASDLRPQRYLPSDDSLGRNDTSERQTVRRRADVVTGRSTGQFLAGINLSAGETLTES